MSKIALKGINEGSATVTVQPPNSVTNRTLTLPDSDGELLNESLLRSILSGTSTLNFLNIEEYSDNSSAILGGLVIGDIYKTPTGEIRIVI